MSITEIIEGGVKFGIHQLCNVETIQWYDIVNMDKKPVMELPAASGNPRCKYNMQQQKAKTSVSFIKSVLMNCALLHSVECVACLFLVCFNRHEM